MTNRIKITFVLVLSVLLYASFTQSNENSISAQISPENKDSGIIIIDVRTPAEFKSGNAQGSINIPLSDLEKKLEEIKRMPQPIVLCCASGSRSGKAMDYLQDNGVKCENAGSWKNVGSYLKKRKNP